jgi:enoyl-CoA hydratase/carnithine racemase
VASGAKVSLTKENDVYVLDLGNDDNILNLQSMKQISDALETVGESDESAALLTVASGNVWSAGFDKDWITAPTSDEEEIQENIKSLEGLVAHLLRLPVISLAAVQGHCFAAGAIFAMAHDVRVMRTNRGYFCLPEVNLAVPFTASISALLQMKLPSSTAFDAMLTGRRYDATQALRAGIVDDAMPISELRESAFARAQSLAPAAGSAMKQIRMQLSRRVLELVETGEPRSS